MFPSLPQTSQAIMNQLHLPAHTLQASTVALPGSKSISNRSLLLAALSDNACTLHSLLQSDDTERMKEALTQLGVPLHIHSDTCLTVHGCGGRFPQTQSDLFLGNAGTAFRPLTAALALQPSGGHRLHGVARMHERPIGDLVDALRQCGAQIDYLGNQGYPPLFIGQRQAQTASIVRVKGHVSSQFLTALLMALPLTGQAQRIEVEGELISKPYIDMTVKLMARFGVEVACFGHEAFELPAQAVYHAPDNLHVEGDASGASYFLAAGLLGGQTVRVTGIGRDSIQGDAAFADELGKLGANVEWGDDFVAVGRASGGRIRAFDLDANAIPDAAMTLAIVALAADGTSTIRNIASWRVKETDRIAAMATELRKLGAEVLETPDSIRITPPAQLNAGVPIDTYDDHRMAMCFSLVSLLGVPVTINDPECVNKTFPDYFQCFQSCMV